MRERKGRPVRPVRERRYVVTDPYYPIEEDLHLYARLPSSFLYCLNYFVLYCTAGDEARIPTMSQLHHSP